MSIMLTVAHYPDNPEWVQLIEKNRERFCKLDGGFKIITDKGRTNGATFDRVRLILNEFEKHDRVIWVDADAVLLHNITEDMLPNGLAFASDAGGINDGICITTSKDVGLWLIVEKILSSPTGGEFSSEKIMRMIRPEHTHLALDLWNARHWNWYAHIIHFAGQNDRFKLVKEACERA